MLAVSEASCDDNAKINILVWLADDFVWSELGLDLPAEKQTWNDISQVAEAYSEVWQRPQSVSFHL
jgi:hypothetical protein